MDEGKNREIHIVCVNHCVPAHREEAKALILEFVAPARAETGCLYYEVYQQRDDPDRFVLLDGWTDQAAVDAHVAHPNVEHVMKRLRPLLIGEPELTFTTRLSDRFPGSTAGYIGP